MWLLAQASTDPFAGVMEAGPIRSLLFYAVLAIVAIAVFAPQLFQTLLALIFKQSVPPINNVVQAGTTVTTELLQALNLQGSNSTRPADTKQLIESIKSQCPLASTGQIFTWLQAGKTATEARDEYVKWLEASLQAAQNPPTTPAA